MLFRSHMVLGCAWLAYQPDLALYELDRARTQDLTAIEEAIVRAARAMLFIKQDWHYHALDELAAIESRLPELGRSAAELDTSTAPAEAEAVMAGVLHLMRYQVYVSLKRNDDAARELALAEAGLRGHERLEAAGHMIAAKLLLDQRRSEERRVGKECRL